MPLTILPWSQSCGAAELSGERALVEVAALEGDVADGQIRGSQESRCGVDSGLDEELACGDAEQVFEPSVELVGRETDLGGDLADAWGGDVFGSDELHRPTEIVRTIFTVGRRLQVARNTGRATASAIVGNQRDLVGQAPALEMTWIEVEFELLGDGGDGSHHETILLEIALAEGSRKNLGGGAADEIDLFAGPAALDQCRIDDPVATLEVLDEKHHVGDVVEELLDIS